MVDFRKPDASAQFRSPERPREPYMGGTAFGCGDHPTLPKRHRWKKRDYGTWRDQICVNCSLTKGWDE